MKYSQGSFIVVPSRSSLRGLDATAQCLYMWLCSYANETGECFPSRAKLAEDCGCSIRTIDASLEILIKKGLVIKEHRFLENKKQTNLYTVVVEGVGAEFAPPPSAESAHRTQSTLSNSIAAKAANLPPFRKNLELPQDLKVVTYTEGRERKPRAVPEEIREVFEIFTKSPARKFWGKDMEPYARAMLELYPDEANPITKLKAAYRLLKEQENILEKPYRVNSPKAFIEKYPDFRLQLNGK